MTLANTSGPALWLALVAAFGCVSHRSTAPAPAFDSPRLAQLWRETRNDAPAALARFWDERTGKGLLVEPVPGDDRDLKVTFLWRGAPDTRYVAVLGGPPGPDNEKPLAQLPGTEVWFLTTQLPRDARLAYTFYVGTAPASQPLTIGEIQKRSGHPDPLNPTAAFGLSFFDLPDAPPQPFAARTTAPTSTATEAKIPSALLHEDRHLVVYTPAGYDPHRAEPYKVAIVLDGEWYGNWSEALIQAPTTVDNLVAQKRIPPVIAVLVDNQGTRNRDLAQSAPFADFLAQELLPWLRRSYRVSTAPRDLVLAGSSLGGETALFTALRHPEAFGSVLSQSGAFFVAPNGWQPEALYADSSPALAALVSAAGRPPLQVWMEVGAFEPTTMREANRRFRDLLQAKGDAVTYREYHGGHDYACWRGSLADGLSALLGPKPR